MVLQHATDIITIIIFICRRAIKINRTNIENKIARWQAARKAKKRSSQLAAHNKLRCTQIRQTPCNQHTDTQTNNGQHVSEHNISYMTLYILEKNSVFLY